MSVQILSPWLASRPPSGARGDIGWWDLATASPIGYEWVLLFLPVGAAALLGVAAGAVLVRRPAGQAWAAACTMAAAWCLLLVPARLGGLVIARAMDPGEAVLQLHVVPWIDGVAGLALLLVAVRTQQPVTKLHLAPWLGGAGLVAAALTPYATIDAGGWRFYVDELTLATGGTGHAAPAAEAARVCLGVVLAITIWARGPGARWAARRPWVHIVPALGALAASAAAASMVVALQTRDAWDIFPVPVLLLFSLVVLAVILWGARDRWKDGVGRRPGRRALRSSAVADRHAR